jgi:hypothetical protein
MTGQVIFLNRWLNCPDEQKRIHYQIQVLICEKKAEFDYETRDYNQFQRALSKQKSHHLWRNRMKIIARNGEIVEE